MERVMPVNRKEKMKTQWLFRKNPFDSRIGICRFIFTRFKVSISLCPYFWKWEPHWKEWRLTLCGLNVHYKSAQA
jgi:hypothetical protein